MGGGWTTTGAPEPFNWILHIKDVTPTFNTAGSGSPSDELDVVDGEGRLVKGTASLTLQISPTFLGSGSFTGAFNAVAVSANLGFSAALNTRQFTAQGNVSGTMLGVQIGSGSGVLSDKGIGLGATSEASRHRSTGSARTSTRWGSPGRRCGRPAVG